MTYLNKQEVLLVSSAGVENMIGPFGEQVTGVKQDDISVKFIYPYLNTVDDINPTASVTTGDGQITVPSPYCQVSSATTGTATVQSRDVIRYRAGHSGFADFTASFSGTGTGYAGGTDFTNGFAIKIVNGVPSFGYIKSGVELGSSGASGFDPASAWNGNISHLQIDWTKFNIFRIMFGYLGISNPVLMIKLDRWYLLHTVKTEGVLTTTHVDSPTFPIAIRAINGMTIRSGSWNGGVIGSDFEEGRHFNFPNTLLISGAAAEKGEMTLSGTNVGTLAVFRAKSTYKTKANKVKANLLSYEFIVDTPSGAGVGTVIFQIVAVSSLSGAGTFTDINTHRSVMEVDSTNGVGSSVSVTVGDPLIQKAITYVGATRGALAAGEAIISNKLGAYSYAGDTFAVIAKDLGGNNVKVRFNVGWEELF